jgi:hypothetical protein
MFQKGQRETLNWLVLNVLRVGEGTNPKPPVYRPKKSLPKND